MSTESESALTPEEWQRRGIIAEAYARMPYAAVLADGQLMVDTSAQEYPAWDCTTDARKLMALANLSLTITEHAAAFAKKHVDVCVSAAWYFRRLAKDTDKQVGAFHTELDSESADRYAALAAEYRKADVTMRELAETLRALVPPPD